ncbi:MAG: flagellar basal body-associated FliL family protein [Candidatus Latescibacteria bacterium]|nr:flagellar basal body-associated FliL family protein [Candidatus Latescibacterota bacterium]
MKRLALCCLWWLLAAGGCAGTLQYKQDDCPFYDALEPIRANPAGAPERHLQVQVIFRVCPPQTGLEEIQRKRIELKHELLVLLSGKSAQDLEDPLRVEKLQQEILLLVNQKVLKKGRVVEVLITGFELQ